MATMLFSIRGNSRRLFTTATATASATASGIVGRSRRLIPPPNDRIKDVGTFLSLIKRGCEQYINKFPNWEALFSMDGKAMEATGIQCKHRRMILAWTSKYRQGIEPYYIPPSLKFSRKTREKKQSNNKSSTTKRK